MESRLPGGDYRVVVGPTWNELNRDETQRRRVEVETLANAIREHMACNELDEVGILPRIFQKPDRKTLDCLAGFGHSALYRVSVLW